MGYLMFHDQFVCLGRPKATTPTITDLYEPRLYSLRELDLLPIGTIFWHSERGPCWIENTTSGKAMLFENGEQVNLAERNLHPWNKPMLLICCVRAEL